MHSFDGVRFDEKKAELNYNISLFLSLENNFGDFKGEEQQGLLVLFFSNVGIIIKLMFFT